MVAIRNSSKLLTYGFLFVILIQLSNQSLFGDFINSIKKGFINALESLTVVNYFPDENVNEECIFNCSDYGLILKEFINFTWYLLIINGANL